MLPWGPSSLSVTVEILLPIMDNTPLPTRVSNSSGDRVIFSFDPFSLSVVLFLVPYSRSHLLPGILFTGSEFISKTGLV